MTKESAIRILTGDVLGTNEEQRHEAVKMAVEALIQPEIIPCSGCKFVQYDPVFHLLWCEGRVVFSRHYCSLGKRREE